MMSLNETKVLRIGQQFEKEKFYEIVHLVKLPHSKLVNYIINCYKNRSQIIQLFSTAYSNEIHISNIEYILSRD